MTPPRVLAAALLALVLLASASVALVQPRPPLHICGSPPNASPWSTASSITRATSSSGWCISSPMLLRRTTPTRPRRTSHRRRSPGMRPSCCRCPALAPRCSRCCLPREATRWGGGTTTRFAVSAGVAPVTRRSGKSMIVTRRQAAHNRLRDAAYHWARVAAQHDPVSHDKYRSLRARGHGHARALRSVADRLLNVACAMLRDRACFDSHRVGSAAT